MSLDATARITAPTATPSVSDATLTPLRFLQRAAQVWATRPAVRDRGETRSYAQLDERVRRAVDMLRRDLGIAAGDRVAALLPNVSAMLELHYAVPAAGGVLVPLNTRLSADEYAYILEHSGARAVFAYAPLRDVLESALARLGANAPLVVWIGEEPTGGDYEQRLAAARLGEFDLPGDERALLSINYTSGTTGRPKGVMTSHRGAYLHSLGVIAETGLTTRSAYLWTLPMFHCNGWAYTWAVTAVGGLHVCLPRVDADLVWASMLSDGITHLCAAPTVVTMMLESPAADACDEPVNLFVGGAPPAPTLLERAAGLNIAVTHLYGLTETYGPIAICAWNPDWDDKPQQERARLRARQGVATVVSERLRVVDDELRDVPADGQTLGEVVMRGNNVMLGYYRDPAGTAEAFRGGWFHSGDVAVLHADGYVELRDRLKDIIISGGENISTIEVEQALQSHPAVVEAAVVARPDERWGEVPVAFVTLRDGLMPSADELREHVRAKLARFKAPSSIYVVGQLPKTATGKIQKFALRESLATLAESATELPRTGGAAETAASGRSGELRSP